MSVCDFVSVGQEYFHRALLLAGYSFGMSQEKEKRNLYQRLLRDEKLVCWASEELN